MFAIYLPKQRSVFLAYQTILNLRSKDHILNGMSTEQPNKAKRVTTHTLTAMKVAGEKIAMLTGYDYAMAQLLDQSGIDVILVGDSASNVFAGNETTLPITLEQMIYHASAVVKACKRALVVVDMPFGTYQGDSKNALRSAIRIMKESGAHAVKMEGGTFILESVQRILSAGIPVMGHLGLIPQSIYKFGTYVVRATDEQEAEQLKTDAIALQQAGCFAIVLEKIPAQLAQHVSQTLHIPIIGIGAGPYCDGQVLVSHDMLGITQGFSPRFLRRYAQIGQQMQNAFSQYLNDVKNGGFPTLDESY
jgi:3-methyl-2-oxobutanoate hydroxymethyltransferase